jgi:5-methylcytosine-specific restriction endonuclease McrA
MALSGKLRTACFNRDDWRCMHCNNRNGLHPHHIKFKSQGGEDVLHNIITVCWICHRAIHDGFLTCIQTNEGVKFTRLRGWHP